MPTMFGFPLFGFQFKLTLFFFLAPLLFPFETALLCFFVCKLHGLLGLCPDTLFLYTSCLALTALGIRSDGHLFVSRDGWRKLQCVVLMKNEILNLLLFRLCTKDRLCHTELSIVNTFKETAPELTVEENRKCNAHITHLPFYQLFRKMADDPQEGGLLMARATPGLPTGLCFSISS